MTKEELEKEATEYALEWGDKTNGTYACCRDGYLAGAEPRDKRIAELEKENAELKNFIMQSKKDGISPINALIIKNLANQLTKAKDALRMIIDSYNHKERFSFEKDLMKAEQFISEVEK